jgi:hypothetical protein
MERGGDCDDGTSPVVGPGDTGGAAKETNSMKTAGSFNKRVGVRRACSHLPFLHEAASLHFLLCDVFYYIIYRVRAIFPVKNPTER